jgi:hypothetical protein
LPACSAADSRLTTRGVCRLGGSGCPVCRGCAEVFVDEADALVVAQAAAAVALMRLAPTCFCAEEQPQQVRQRAACVTPKGQC